MRNKIISVFVLGFSFLTFQNASDPETVDTTAGATVSSTSFVLDANASASVEELNTTTLIDGVSASSLSIEENYVDSTSGASVSYDDDDEWDDDHDEHEDDNDDDWEWDDDEEDDD